MKGRPLQILYCEAYHLIHPSIIAEPGKAVAGRLHCSGLTTAGQGFDKNDQYQEMASMSIGLIKACNEKIKCPSVFFLLLFGRCRLTKSDKEPPFTDVELQ